VVVGEVKLSYFGYLDHNGPATDENCGQIFILLSKYGAKPFNVEEFNSIFCQLKLSTAAIILQNSLDFFAELKSQALNAGVSRGISNLLDCVNSMSGKYSAYISGDESALTDQEKEIFSDNPNIDVLMQSSEGERVLLFNIAVLEHNTKLIEWMIDSNYIDLSREQYSSTVTHPLLAVALLSSQNNDLKLLLTKITKNMENTDITVDDNGETLTHYLFQNAENIEARNEIAQQTTDKMFYFFKNNTDIFLPSSNPLKVNIALSAANENWSTGVWGFASVAHNKFPQIDFYIIPKDVAEKGGDKFLMQFDAVLSPGGGDSYPKNMSSFGLKDYSSSTELEPYYQYMANRTYELKIPYMGLCAGAQHLSLYHQSNLQPVAGYKGTTHQVTYFKATAGYFWALSEDQKQMALDNCTLREISFKGDTAHSYAAVAASFTNLELAAISEDGVAMSYCHENGIRCATQFYPEHFWASNSKNAEHQKYWLESFLSMAQMHKEYRVNGGVHPEDYMKEVQGRLSSCSANEVDEL